MPRLLVRSKQCHCNVRSDWAGVLMCMCASEDCDPAHWAAGAVGGIADMWGFCGASVIEGRVRMADAAVLQLWRTLHVALASQVPERSVQ